MIFQLIAGSREDFIFNHRLFNSTCFITILVVFIYVFVGFNVGGAKVGLINLVAFFLFGIIYYISRFRKKTKVVLPIFTFLLLTLLTLQWFQTEGLMGVIPLAMIMVLLIVLYSFETKYHSFYIVGILTLISTLIYVDFNYPELINHYPTELKHRTSLVIMTIVTMSTCSVLANLFVKAYEEEKQNAEQQYQDLIRVESEIEYQNLTLEALNDELKHIAYRTSHDLVAPLKTVKGYNEILLELIEEQDLDTARSIVNNIRANLQNMEELVLNMANVVESDEEKAPNTSIDFLAIIQKKAEKHRQVSTDNRVVIRSNIQHTAPFFGNKIYIEQILEQLIVNGIKFSDKKKNNRFVKITTQEEASDQILIEVSDNGLGIPKAAGDKIFDMFYRAHSIRTHGSGLGLYLVKKLVVKMGGEINFVSSPEGTKFLIKLPNQPQTSDF